MRRGTSLLDGVADRCSLLGSESPTTWAVARTAPHVLRAGCPDDWDKPIPNTKFAYLTNSRPYGCSSWACLAQAVQGEFVKTSTHLPDSAACKLAYARTSSLRPSMWKSSQFLPSTRGVAKIKETMASQPKLDRGRRGNRCHSLQHLVREWRRANECPSGNHESRECKGKMMREKSGTQKCHIRCVVESEYRGLRY